jgi:hypothetical protein
MGTIRNILRKTPLRPLYQWQHRTRRNFIFREKFREVVENPDIRLDNPQVLDKLTYGWANWVSPSTDFLVDLVKYSSQAKYPILDCGSGLSTIIAGLVAKRQGNTVWSLESLKPWHRRVKHYLDKYQLDSVKLLYCPLKKRDGFSWYDVPLDILPEKFSLVSCDGPPHQEGDGDARRYGLFPIMRERLAPECVILFDNSDLEEEREGLYFWINKVNAQYEKVGIDKSFLQITLP